MKEKNKLLVDLKKHTYEYGPDFLMGFLESVFTTCFLKALKNDDLKKANQFLHAVIYAAPEINNIKEAIEERDLLWDIFVGKKTKKKYSLKKIGETFEIIKKK